MLDVGCGTGRLLLDYLADAVDIDGVDNSPEMLALCREKAVELGLDVEGRLSLQEMDALDLQRRYLTILVPSSSFQLVIDPTAAAVTLARFKDHMEPGGLLVMSMMSKLWWSRRVPPQMEWSEWHMMVQRERPGRRDSIRRWIRSRYDHEEQVQHEENRYEIVQDDVVVAQELHQRSPAVRWYTQDQTIQLMESAGFEDVRLTSGFTMDPAQAEDTTFCVLGYRR